MKKLDTKTFIERAVKTHGNKYDYSKTEYVDAVTKVCIICHEKDSNGVEHGEFWQIPYKHLNGCGCKKCVNEKLRKERSFTKEEFIEKSNKAHNFKYDYSEVDYVNNNTKVKINCKIHGEFWQTPCNHMKGEGCPKCANENTRNDGKEIINKLTKKYSDKFSFHKSVYVNSRTKILVICKKCGFEFYANVQNLLKCNSICPNCMSVSREEFEEKARKVHGNKYDYSEVEYHGVNEKVCIICPDHGAFYITPSKHLIGHGCTECVRHKWTENEFISAANKKHNGKYNYSNMKFNNLSGKICIICPEHGEFYQLAAAHLKGQGCPNCKGGVKISKEEFVSKSIEKHGGKYDYSKVEYVNSHINVCIICKKCGFEFWQTPNSHLSGCGCPKCKYMELSDKLKSNTEEFLNKANKIHNFKYNYSKVEYKSAKEKVCIICPEHGEFWQSPDKHLHGEGCPKCKRYGKYEIEVYETLKKEFSDAIYHYRDKELLGALELDIYIPSKECAIEVQGGQHFAPVAIFGGEKNFEKQCVNDKRKFELCEKNGIKLLYCSNAKNLPFEYFDKIYTDLDELVEVIKAI